jgi:hypothetical protein
MNIKDKQEERYYEYQNQLTYTIPNEEKRVKTQNYATIRVLKLLYKLASDSWGEKEKKNPREIFVLN